MRRTTLFGRWPTAGVLVLAAVALLRLASLGQLALLDNTESRYGDIAWQMARSGDWIIPWTHAKRESAPLGNRLHPTVVGEYPWAYVKHTPEGDLVPFGGKPPLQFWLTVLSYRALGVSEFSARLPSFLVAILTVAATVCFAAGILGRCVAVLSGIILGTSVEMFVLAGACELDVPLAASTTLAMIAFALFVRRSGRPRKAWGLAFFLALAVGMLAKGPVALVLVGLTVGLWIMLTRRWRLAIELPWIAGPALFLAVAAPWYLLAERATPGFLWYFLVNENFLRYLVNNYGDCYGWGRLRPYGTIWLMLLLALLPWTVLVAATLIKSARAGTLRIFRQFRWSDPRPALSALARLPGELGQSDPWLAYVLIWGLTPPLFFTLARQIVWTYVLPGLPGLAIATAVGLQAWMQSDDAARLLRLLKWHLAALGVTAAAAAVVATTFYGGRLGLAPPAVLGIAALTLLAIAALIVPVRAVARRQDHTAAVALVGLAAAATFAAGFFLFRSWIDDQNSAKAIVAEVFAKDPAARQRPIAAPLGESTFSASFYVEAIYHGRFDHYAVKVIREKGKEKEADQQTARELLDRPRDEILLVKRRDWVCLAPWLGDGLVLTAQTANWVACQRRP